MIIDITYDASVATNPQEAAFKATVAGVAAFFESEFSNPITINWDVGWGEVDGHRIPNYGGAESYSNYTSQYTYSQLKAAFTADNDTTALASLPASDPTAGGDGGFSMTTAEGKALGLVSANNTAIDGWSGLDKTSTWIYNTSNTSGSNVPAGDLDAFSFLAHELSEVMGRQMYFGQGSGDGVAGDGYNPLDLFDYTADGVRALTNSATADRYFSIDGGKTNTAQHYFNNVAANGDLFDYIPNGTSGSYLPNGPADSFDYEGSIGAVSAGDLTLMETLGYTPSTSTATNIHWTSQISGNFPVSNDWTPHVTPGAADAAILDAPGSTAYIVIASANETVASVQTASTARLAITGGVFTITNGTGAGSNAGQVSVTQNGTLDIGGVFANSRETFVENNGAIQVAAGGLTLTGSGSVYLADNTLKGATTGATLTTSNFIYGAGQLGDGKMTLVNQTGGVIESYGSSLFTINTGANIITNAGIFLATSAGGMTIASAVANTGHFAVNGGSMTVMGAVTGSGYAEVVSGTLDFAGAFNENVVFTAGSTGALELAHSIGYTGRIQGLSTTGANALDLGDITFTSGVTTAAFSGSTTSGVLTVTDGTHTARIGLIGNYVGHTFTTSLGAGGVGTRIVDPPAAGSSTISPLAPPPHAFIAAMAVFGPSAGVRTTALGCVEPATHAFLAAPRFTQAA